MILLTRRQSNIILHLMNQENYCTIKKLSEIFKVSNRTIRYDLDYIEEWMKDLNINFIRKPKKGIKISNINANKEKIREALSSFEDRILSIQERRLFIMLKLFLTKNYITLQELADRLYVSKNTIANDIDYIDNLFEVNGIILHKRPRYGMCLDGEEEKLRNYFVNLVKSDFQKDFLGNYGFYKLFDESKFKDTINTIKEHEIKIGTQYTEESKKELLIYLLIAVNRIAMGRKIYYSKEMIDEYRSKVEFNIVKDLVVKLEEKYEITFTEGEIIYLMKIFLGAKRRSNIKYKDSYEKVDFEVMSIIEGVVLDIQKTLGVDLSNDIEFINALRLHLQIAVYRLKNNLEITNPLTENIKYRNPFIFEASKKILGEYEKLIGKSFPDDEIAYVAMHIGAAFERHKQNGFMPKALLVCGMGLATSNLLKTRLNIMMPEIKLVGPVGVNECKKIIENENIDFVISTRETDIENTKVIIVNPLLENEDLNKIKTLIFKNIKRKQLMYLSKQNIYETQEKKVFLKDMLKKDSVTLKYDCKNWREAIFAAADPLLKKGYIIEDYIRAMIEAVEKMGPYMVIIPGIALNHALAEKGVLKDCLSLLTLKETIDFGDKDSEPVKMIIVFGTNKSNKYFKILTDLIKVLEKKENIKKIYEAENYEEIMDLSN